MTSPTPTSDLTELLGAAGVPDTFVPATAAHLGERAADRLRADPWELLLVPAVRPEQADHFARRVLGDAASPDDPRRGRALVAHLLGAAARQGHTALPAKAVADRLAGLGVPDPVKAVMDALDEARVLAVSAEDLGEDEESEPEQLLALARYAMAEDAVAEGLMRLAATAEGTPGVTLLSGPGSVEAALATATETAEAGLRTVIATITGRRTTELAATPGLPLAAGVRPDAAMPNTGTGSAETSPGTSGAAPADAATGGTDGRTAESPAGDGAATTVAADTAACTGDGAAADEPGGQPDSAGNGAARTGDGVAHGADLGGGEGLAGEPDEGEVWRGVRVMSLGRLLEAVPAPGGLAFGRGEQRAVEADVVVVPDAGALDVELAAALVEACADGTRLVLAGDPAELPSAGPGRVLGDVVAAGVLPVVRTQTAGPDHETPIEQLLGGVREGELEPVEAPGREVVMVPAASAAEAVHRAVQLVTDSIPRALGIPAADVQVLAPAATGEAGTGALNAALKERLNPGPGAYRGFDPGDRVVVVAPLPDVAVGETGTVLEATATELRVEFPGGTAGIAPGLLPRLRPGWAITVTQALGTRWPAVVAVFPETVPVTRPLVASAIARAARHLSLVHGAAPELARAVRDLPGTTRQTRLVGLLREM